MSYLIRGITKNGHFKFACVEGRDLVEEGRKIHNTLPTTTAAFGRVLIGAALLSADIKEGKVILQVKGDGPLGSVTAEARYDGWIRGYPAKPDVHLPPKEGKLDVGGAIGKNGVLDIIFDYGLKEPYVTSVPLQTGEIGDDLAYYYAYSLQIPAVVAVGVHINPDNSVRSAGGILIEAMPDATDEEIVKLEENVKKMGGVTPHLNRGEKIEDLTKKLLDFDEVEILLEREIFFRCWCSKEKSEEAVVALGPEEIKKSIEKNEPIEVTCKFCLKKYIFTPEELKSILEKIESE